MMKLTILGCYAATPRTSTNPTSQVLEVKKQLFLIDCGEGTQVQLRRHKIKFSRIEHIFISHLHGDHFFGLPGLVSTYRLMGRTRTLHIYGPKGIKEALTLMLKVGDSWTNYPLVFHELEGTETQTLFADADVTVATIPLDHRIYTNGFLFKEKPGERKLDVVAVAKYKVPQAHFRELKQGRNVTLPNGREIDNAQLTLDPPPPKKYAYCSDTAYNPRIVSLIRGVDALYHEATFLDSESQLAVKTKHSTAREAATIACKADVGTLILGHYSTRYKSLEAFRKEAETIFPNVALADDGASFEL